MSYRDEFNALINFEEGGIKAYYFRGRNTAVMARSVEEARSKKKRGGDELVAVRTPSESDRKAMAAGRWVRTRRDGKSPSQSKYGKGRGQGPARKSKTVEFSKLDWLTQFWSDKSRQRIEEQTQQLKSINRLRRAMVAGHQQQYEREKKPYALLMSAREELNELMEFTTLGATKDWLRDLKAQGVSLDRDSKAGKGRAAYQSSKKTIQIPRGYSGAGVIQSSPRIAFWHEAGHAQAHLDGKMTRYRELGKLAQRDAAYGAISGDPKAAFNHLDPRGQFMKEGRRQEIIANKNALSRMEAYGVPKENISGYRRTAAQGLNTYRVGNMGPKYRANIEKAQEKIATRNTIQRGYSNLTGPVDNLVRAGRGATKANLWDRVAAGSRKLMRSLRFSARDEFNELMKLSVR